MVFREAIMANLTISKLGPENEVLLRNLYEHYIHDMSEWLPLDTRADGSYSFDTAMLWREGYEVYLAREGELIVGFAITGTAAEWSAAAGAHDVHEFFILRRFRRTGAGKQLAEHIFNLYPGGWVVRVLENNLPAVPFWRAAVAAFTGGAYIEESRVVKERDWRFFRFGGA